MTATDLIFAAVLLIILAAAIFYIVREKRKGVKCIGCPYAEACARRRQGGCSCQTDAE